MAKGFAARLEAALDKRLPGKVYYFDKWDDKLGYQLEAEG